MNPDSRKLRDALKNATSGHQSLTDLMNKVGPDQTELAMTKAWQSCSNARTWRRNEEIVMLVECCKTFPILGKKAASLLEQAPLKQVGPGIIPTLGAQPWAREILERWADLNELSKPTKAAIENLRKKH